MHHVPVVRDAIVLRRVLAHRRHHHPIGDIHAAQPERLEHRGCGLCHVDLEALRRYAVARTLFPPTTLQKAIERLGFVQADPIRAPARAQDLTLRHRVIGYRAGDLERRYAKLDVDEDFFCLLYTSPSPRDA